MIPRINVEVPFTASVAIRVRCFACGDEATVTDAVFITGGTGASFDLPRGWSMLAIGSPVCPKHQIVVQDLEP